MTMFEKKQPSVWVVVVFILWLIINIRVEAGLASSLERTLDGIVGGALLLVLIFLGLSFFKSQGLISEKDNGA